MDGVCNVNKIDMSGEIPKNIIQVYFPDKNDLPKEINENIEKLKKMNPNWSYFLYDDYDIEEYIEKSYGSYMLNVYKKINPIYGAARVDFFRYLVMYHKGGIYLDIKSTIDKPLDEVILQDDYFLLSKWDSPSKGFNPELKNIGCQEYIQWCIISRKGHPYMRNVIRNMICNIENYSILKFGVGKRSILRVTGPIMYTKAIKEIESDHQNRKVNFERDLGIKYSIYANGNHHKNLFKNHYANLDYPLVDSHINQFILKVISIYQKRMHRLRKSIIKRFPGECKKYLKK